VADELKQVSRDRQLFSRLAPEVKAQVLHLLNVRGQLNDEVILWSLADESTGVREQALIFAESRLAGSPSWSTRSSRGGRFRSARTVSMGASGGELHDDRTIPGWLALRSATPAIAGYGQPYLVPSRA